jgi:hypothetical protein
MADMLTIAACPDIDHVVQIASNMILNVTAELHLGITWLFIRG